MWRKHTIARLASLPIIGVFVISTLLASTWMLLSTEKAYAADFSPSKQAAAWNAGLALANCSRDAGWSESRTAADLASGNLFRRSRDLSITDYAQDNKTVGYLVEPSDGVVRCNSKEDVMLLFRALDVDPTEFLKKTGIYKIKSGGDGYEFSSGSGSSGNAAAATAIRSEVQRKFGFNYGNRMPDDIQYAALKAAFSKKCLGGRDSGGVDVQIAREDGTVETIKYVLKGGVNDGGIKVGYSLDADGGNDQQMSCPTIVQQMNKYANAYAATVKSNLADNNPSNDAAVGGGADGLNGENAPTCETSGNPATWFLCPIFNGVADFSDWMFRNMVEPLLRTAPVSTDPNNGSFQVWSSFRLYGNIILLISMLVIVFGQAIGGGVVDAYTAKKVMPRILVAAVLVNLSIYIVAIMVDITNILGGGIGQLMTAPFAGTGQFSFSPNAAQSITIGGGSILAFISALIFIPSSAIGSAASILGLFVLLPAALGIIGAFLTMVIRQGVILTLILISPVAFALYCLPNTEQYFKKWWSTLFKTLLVYPIVIVMFAVADILAITIQEANGFGGGPLLTQTPANIIAGIVAFVAMFLPLVLIPWAFKMAGGIIGSLVSTLSNFSNKGVEAIKGNPNDPNSRRNRTKTNFDAKLVNRRNLLGTSLKKKAALAEIQAARGVRGARGRARAGNLAQRIVAGPGLEARFAAIQKREIQRLEDQKATGPDPSIRDVFATYDDHAGVYWNPLKDESLYMADDQGNYFDIADMDYDAATGAYTPRAGAVGRYGYDGSNFVDGAGNVVARDRLGLNKKAVISEGAVKTARTNAMSNPMAFQQTLNYEMEKANKNGKLGILRKRFTEEAQRAGMSVDEASAMWKVVGYRQQGMHLIEKFSGFEVDQNTGEWVDAKPDLNGVAFQFGGKHKGYEQTGQSDRTWGAIRDDINEVATKVAKGETLSAAELDRMRYWQAGISALDRGIPSQVSQGGANLPAQGQPLPGQPVPVAGGSYFSTGGSGTAEQVAIEAKGAMDRLIAGTGGAASPFKKKPSGAGESGMADYIS